MSEFPVAFDEKLVGEYPAEAKSAGTQHWQLR